MKKYTEQEKEILKKYPKYFEPLDDEEKQLQKDLDRGLYKENNSPARKKKYSKIATNYLKNKENRKNKPITIRADENVIDKIKDKAAGYGMNYQTYINLFLYQLAEDRFKIEIR